MAPPSIRNRPRSRAPTGINRPGYSSSPTGVNRPGTSSPAFSGYSAPKRPASSGGSSPGSGYTPGGDSFKNYSQKDQGVMFDAAGGKDKFIEMAGNLQQKYPRGLDYQRFLDKSKQYFNAQSIGGKEVIGPDGIMRLQMSGADVPMKDAQGRTILSMMRPELTAQAPTLGQLVGDMARGAGSMLKGIAKLPGQAFEAYQQLSPLANILQQAQSYGSKVFNPGDIAGRLQAAGPDAQQRYGQFMQQPGMTYQKAFEMATGSPFSTGTNATVPMSMTDTPITNAPMPDANMMQTSGSLNNLTEFGQSLANRIKTDRPNISNADLLEALQRSNRTGFASQGRPVFTTGMYAQGGVASL